MENPNNYQYQYQQLNSQKGGGSGSSKGKVRSPPPSSSSKPMKVKYISSPMMVRASNASEFRAIVQELTGQNSDVVRSKLEEATATGMSMGTAMAIIKSSADDGVVGGLHPCQRITSTAAAAAAATTNAAAVLTLTEQYDYVHDGTDRILPSCNHQHDHLSEASLWRELINF